MNTTILMLIILGVSLIVLFLLGRKMLKADNRFMYSNGRAMRSLDISLAIDRDKFNHRISMLTDETVARYKKWLLIDFAFMPALYLSTAILCYFSSSAYLNPGLNRFFILLALLQGLSFLCDIIENLVLMQSVKRKSIQIPMQAFNLVVILKFIFPVLALFVCFATAMIIWFRFLFGLHEPYTMLVFLAPSAVIIAIVVALLTKKKAVQNAK